jgi:hypothetical protein
MVCQEDAEAAQNRGASSNCGKAHSKPPCQKDMFAQHSATRPSGSEACACQTIWRAPRGRISPTARHTAGMNQTVIQLKLPAQCFQESEWSDIAH